MLVIANGLTMSARHRNGCAPRFSGSLSRNITRIDKGERVPWSVKRIDDTPIDENESEATVEAVLAAISATMSTFRTKIESLELRIANMETQRTPQDENDDPEWFS